MSIKSAKAVLEQMDDSTQFMMDNPISVLAMILGVGVEDLLGEIEEAAPGVVMSDIIEDSAGPSLDIEDVYLYTIKPIVTNGARRIPTDKVTTISVNGDYFDTETTVELLDETIGTVGNIAYMSPSEISFDITTGSTEGQITYKVKNFLGESEESIIDVVVSTWVDLRLDGNAFTEGSAAGNDIRYKAGMSMSRDANGMYFDGATPWTSWVKFESLGWTRGEGRSIEWIMTNPTAAMMIGIGSDATDESNSAQYSQGETLAYLNSSTTLWGLYGNNGVVGTNGSQASASSFPVDSVLKIRLTSDGAAGGLFEMFIIPSANEADWDNEENLIKTETIGGTLNPDESNIMPFIIPRGASTQRFIAIKNT